jgi:hypothetical protein
MPPADWTVSIHARCSGRMRPVGVLTSIDRNPLPAGPPSQGYGHLLPADEVGAAFAQPKLHWAAVLVLERAGVIAEEPGSAG